MNIGTFWILIKIIKHISMDIWENHTFDLRIVAKKRHWGSWYGMCPLVFVFFPNTYLHS